MTPRNAQLLDLYTDYLLASFGQATATGLAALLPELSHDRVTRFLSQQELTDKDLWKIVKPHLRRIQSEEAVLIVDDTVEEKPYTDESELVTWHFDHTVGRAVIHRAGAMVGVNLLSALYLSDQVSLPVAFHLIQKTELVTDPKTGKERWQSPKTKNEVAREMIGSVVAKQIPLRYVLADTWFSSADNLLFIKQKAKKDFVIPLKSNRNVFLSAPSAKAGKPTKLSALDFGTEGVLTLYLESVPFALLVCRQVFTNEDGSEGVLYLCTSDLSLTAPTLCTLYQKRWSATCRKWAGKVEEYHKSLKSNAAFSKSPTKLPKTQSNHFFASLVAFVNASPQDSFCHL